MIHQFFIGFDDASPIAYNVAQFSVMRHAGKPISITPMVLETLPIERRGLTKFTFTRFLVPYLMGYRGWGLWMDADIIFTEDPTQIWDFADTSKAVIVADVMPFERAAIMLFNCGHPDNRILTPEFIETAERLHTISWTSKTGLFPGEWNHLVGYDEPNGNAKGIHFTQGLPSFRETADSEHQEKWMLEQKLMNSTKSWAELMGKSVHAVQTADGLVPKFKAQHGAHNVFQSSGSGR